MSSTNLYILSQPVSKTPESFVLWKIFPCFLQCEFSETVSGSVYEAFKKLCVSLSRHDICRGFKFGELGGHCYNICYHDNSKLRASIFTKLDL